MKSVLGFPCRLILSNFMCIHTGSGSYGVGGGGCCGGGSSGYFSDDDYANIRTGRNKLRPWGGG